MSYEIGKAIRLADLIGGFDWSATPLGALERWPQSLRTSVDITLASGHAMQLAWGPELTVLYNDAYAPMLGERHPAALGRPFHAAWPEIWSDIEPLVRRVFAGETVRFENMPLVMTRHGYREDTWWNFSYSPIRDEAGAIVGLLNVTLDATPRVRAERERDGATALLQQNETRFRALVTAGANSFYRMSPDWKLMYQLDSRTLANSSGPIDNWVDKYIPDEDRPRVFAAIEQAIRTRSLYELEHRVLLADGSIGWVVSRAVPLLGHDREVIEWFGVGSDVTVRREALERLRESDERQAFLLRLNDVLRSFTDPNGMLGTALRLVGEHLKVNRVLYAEMADDDATYVILDNYVTPGFPRMAGRFPVTSFGAVIESYRRGHDIVIPDIHRKLDLSDEERDNYIAAHVIAGLGAPILKSGQLVGLMAVHHGRPHEWSRNETAILREAAERIWHALERVRGEALLRDSEERFRQFAAASAGALWVRDAVTLKMEYGSPAIHTVYGVGPGTVLHRFESWAGLVIPEDRDIALQHLEKARQGESVIDEFRIQRPSDLSFRWIRDSCFPLRDETGRVHRIGGIVEDVTDAKLAIEHQAVLLAELQHRVRNIMAIIRSITARTAEYAGSVSDYAARMTGRLLALARVQALLTRVANAEVGVRSIVHDEVCAQEHHIGQYALAGPDVALSPNAAEILTLAVHELATNALKYGAFRVPDGRINVQWSVVEQQDRPWLVFDWAETGAPQESNPEAGRARRRGFGSELIEERIPYELKGRGQLSFEPAGARCRLEFPLKDGSSVLETGAPRRATVFGGALDMSDEANLRGRRVLVVEDDYYLATDAARALRGAGAEVVGPASNEADARTAIAEQRPDAALVDINLGLGPSFTLAEKLRNDGIPFVFVTGYDQDVIPPEFKDIERIEKPVQLRQLVGAVAKLLNVAR
jgi:PAS domain S-box-containing protein